MQSSINVTLRNWRDTDLPALFDLNQANIPHVGVLSRDSLKALLEQCCRCRIAERKGKLVGFLLALLPDADYASENFQWFKNRYSRFLYIDRIAVHKSARRMGVASCLYADAEMIARSKHVDRITCEVNLNPRNDISLRFHESRGYREVGIQDTKNATVTVSLLVKELGDENLG